jgi:ubiquinone/menaquinone biosynthesis C-methylase UbiE
MLKIKLSKFLIFSISFMAILLLPSSCSCQGPDDWEARHNAYQPPQQVMDSIGIKSGMVVAEIGAGRGRYVVKMAKRVGMEGKIYANDINRTKLDYLQERCKRDNINNIETILGDATHPRLPENEIDLIYIINTYHHIENPVGILKNTKAALKEDGLLVIIEHNPDKIADAGSHATEREEVISQAREAGFSLTKMQDFLERDTIYFFRVD